mmetsp:Transcript_1108/g.3973  ORF Transcript_1108/g.3973 Transcript_1108/m.3973 type:complete len:386 (+) Transcript_1108:20-1177(+)
MIRIARAGGARRAMGWRWAQLSSAARHQSTAAPLVYCTRKLPMSGITKLKESGKVDLKVWEESIHPQPRERLFEKVKNARGLVTLLSDKVDKELLDHAPNLKIISQFAVGYNNIDLEECTRRGIMVTNTPGVLTNAMVETTIGLLLATSRRIAAADRWLRDGKWVVDWHPECMGLGAPEGEHGLGYDISEATIGIVGMGNIGQEVAIRSMAAFHPSRVVYSSRRAMPEFEKRFAAASAALGGPATGVGLQRMELDDLCKQADFVILLCSLNPSTVGLFNEQRIGLLKKNCVLVNVSRGPVVDEAALTDALKKGKIFGAGLDVFEKEPLPTSSELLKLDNVVILPHIGSGSVRTRSDMSDLVASNQIAFWSGQTPENLVNTDVLKR